MRVLFGNDDAIYDKLFLAHVGILVHKALRSKRGAIHRGY
jgi:hypothetical protein